MGAASATLVAPKNATLTDAFIHPLPGWLGKLTLLAIAVGGIAANALNIYSGTLSFVAMGLKLPASVRRATVALVFGVAGTIVAWTGLHDSGDAVRELPAGHHLLDRPVAGRGLRRPLAATRPGPDAETGALLEDTSYRNWSGPVAMAVGTVLGIVLFSNQTDFTGVVAKHVPQIGDIAFAAGFVIAGPALRGAAEGAGPAAREAGGARRVLTPHAAARRTRWAAVASSSSACESGSATGTPRRDSIRSSRW